MVLVAAGVERERLEGQFGESDTTLSRRVSGDLLLPPAPNDD